MSQAADLSDYARRRQPSLSNDAAAGNRPAAHMCYEQQLMWCSVCVSPSLTRSTCNLLHLVQLPQPSPIMSKCQCVRSSGKVRLAQLLALIVVNSRETEQGARATLPSNCVCFIRWLPYDNLRMQLWRIVRDKKVAALD
jgi:hypothetical protein